MGDEIVQLKPNVYGIGIDLKALARLWRSGAGQKDVGIASRFLQVFASHGLQPGHIPRLIPSLRYSDLTNEQALLSALTPELVDAVGKLFGVRPEWIVGIDECKYETAYCYKSPQRLFDVLDGLVEAPSLPLLAISTVKVLDKNSCVPQRVELVTVEKVTTLGDTEVHRYRPFADGWDWSHAGCRIQLKAMVRSFGRPVPLYKVTIEQMEAFYSGQIFPQALVSGPRITDPSLEDYALSSAESHVSKEGEEIPLVLRYLSEHCLVARREAR